MQDGCVRLLTIILCVSVPLVACGGTTFDARNDALTVAEAEIVELENRLDDLDDGGFELREQLLERHQRELEEIAAANDALIELNTGLEGKVARIESSLQEIRTLIELFGEEDAFFELLMDQQSTIDSLIDAADVPLYSSGPCGVFRLSGTELLKLRWSLDDRDDIDPRDSSSVWWEKTGIDIGHEIQGYDLERRELWPHLQRGPDHVMAFRVAEGRNHFFHVEWVAALSDDYHGSRLYIEDGWHWDMEDLLGASQYMQAAVLGVDESCNWGIYLTAMNSYLTTQRPTHGQDGDWARWFVEFRAKDYSCDERPAPYNSTRYDAEADRFVRECPSPSG